MTSLIVLRHAQSAWNEVGRWQGSQYDQPLSSHGRQEATKLSLTMPPSWLRAVVFASPMRRALETARILRSDVEPHIVGELSEYDAGEWSGLTVDEIETRWPGHIRRLNHGELEMIPGGQVMSEFSERVMKGMKIVDASRDGKPALIITHAGVVRDLARQLGYPEPFTPVQLSGVKLRTGTVGYEIIATIAHKRPEEVGSE